MEKRGNVNSQGTTAPNLREQAKIGCVHVPWWGRSFSDSFYCYGNMDGKVNVSLRHFSCWQTKIWKKCICNCGFKDRRGPRSKKQSRAKIVSR